MSLDVSNTLELDTGVNWEAKNELNRLIGLLFEVWYNFAVMKDWRNIRYLFSIEKPNDNWPIPLWVV